MPCVSLEGRARHFAFAEELPPRGPRFIWTHRRGRTVIVEEKALLDRLWAVVGVQEPLWRPEDRYLTAAGIADQLVGQMLELDD